VTETERNDTRPRPRLVEKRGEARSKTGREADTTEVKRKEEKLVNTINERTQKHWAGTLSGSNKSKYNKRVIIIIIIMRTRKKKSNVVGKREGMIE
jgi:hypothetical protein